MKLFKIGEIAKLFHLSVSSIRHYENMGLVVPEHIDERSGYRYYSTRQFEAFNTIRYLRAIDMPLDEISDFMKGREVEKIEQKLRIQQQKVEKKLCELKKVKKKIENRIKGIEDAKSSRLDEIQRSVLPACRMFFASQPIKINDYRDIEGPTIHLAESQDEAVIFLGKVGVGISADHLAKGGFCEYDGIFLLLDEEDEFAGEVKQFAEMPCVTGRFRGSHTEAPEQYAKLMDYIKKNNLKAAGFSREITLIDYGFTTDKNEYVTEISIPVCDL